MRPVINSSKEFIQNFWKHYKLFEEDLLETERYVTLSQDNFDTYSVEYNKLYLSICSEVDVVLKLISQQLGKPDVDKIDDYFFISLKCVGLKNEKVKLIEEEFIINPWNGWEIGNPPIWWTFYNKVKHERLTICNNPNSPANGKPYYKMANLQNVLTALAGLYILEFYCLLIYCIKNQPDNYNCMLPIFKSKIFTLTEWHGCCQSFIGEFVDKKIIESIILRKIQL